MPNRDTEIGQEYWRLTIHDWQEILALGTGEEGGPDEPPKFTILRGERISLQSRIPVRIGDARLALDDHHPANGTTPDGVDIGTLATLLHYSFGFSRVVLGPNTIWPHHRFVASARCFYPTELYVWLSARIGGSPGVYHYDPLHHALVRLREGDHRELLATALDTDLSGSDCVVLLTSRFWKNAFRYRHYSYRLCSQEAGLVAGNVLLVAGALGLCGHIHYQFLDQPVNRLLGLRPGAESAMTVIPIHPRSATEPSRGRRGARRNAAEVADEIGEIFPQGPPTPDGNEHLWSWVATVDEHTRLERTEDFAELPAPSRVEGEEASEKGAETILPAPRPTVPRPDMELVTALRRRHSGDILFNPEPFDLSAAVFADIVWHALAPYTSDTGPAPFTRCFAVVCSVDGVEPGVYEVARDGRRLRRVPSRPVGELLGHILVQPPSVNIHSANAIIYLVSDHLGALKRLGNRSYRALTQDAGIVAQRMSVMCGAVSLAARVHNGMPTEEVERALGLPERQQAPTFQLIIGGRRATGRYEPSLIF